ncbi:MAG: methyltransferase domain-containing protein [Polyangiaceae bacterium]
MGVLSNDLFGRLRCATCKGMVARREQLVCGACGARYPVVRDVPIVIDEANSLFRIAECAATAHEVTSASHPQTWTDRARAALRKLAPTAGENLAGEAMLRLLAAKLRAESPRPRVLVIGGRTLGVGMKIFADDPAFDLAEADIAFGPRTNLVMDGGSIPFEDATFDAVIAQAVLEYVPDPFRVADEIHRVLRPRGWVYAESPFMQQVHGGAYDFFRFTHVGHRRLLRRFEEHRSGIACGPAMALSWSYRYFLRALADGRAYRTVSSMFANLTSSWLVAADSHIQERPGAYDAASAFYFLGTRSERALSDREILTYYRGEWRLRG